MTAVAGVPYQVNYYPTANGATYDPEAAGGAVTRLEVLTQAVPAVVVADVGPAVRIVAGQYRFPFITLPAGTYSTRVTWTPATGVAPVVDTNDILTVALLGGSLASIAWRPTTAEIHSAIPTRPVFTTTSKPTIDQVNTIIDRVVESFLAEFPTLAVVHEPIAHAYTVYRVAAEIEWSYDPEQQFGGDNAIASRLDLAAGAELAKLRTLTGSSISSTSGPTTQVRGRAGSTRLIIEPIAI